MSKNYIFLVTDVTMGTITHVLYKSMHH